MRTVETETDEEFVAIAHLRGWCHDSNECPVCREFRAGRSVPIREATEG